MIIQPTICKAIFASLSVIATSMLASNSPKHFICASPIIVLAQEEDQLTGEAKMMLNLLDLNENGKLEQSELEGDAADMLGDLDANNDSVITREELKAASGETVDVHSKLSAINTFQNPQRIVDLPTGIHRGLNRHFKKYTNVFAPNGGTIHFIAMDGWSNDRIIRARKVMEHFLQDVPDRQWGDKTALANAMANNHATMVLLNNSRDMDRVMPAVENLNLQLQDLRANESPFEGEADYMKHETRDAAYEEVFHLIHASGVLDAMKGYDREIRKLAKQATAADLWNYDEPNMPGNHFEYIICVYDNYLDLWQTKPTMMEGRRMGKQQEGRSFHGEYKADERANTRTADPQGFAMIEKFNPNHITYSPELPADFQGTFSLAAGANDRYSSKAKHLLNATLCGNGTSALTGNRLNNRLVGNQGNNLLTGHGGDDSLFGGGGEDTAVYRGPKSQYTISKTGNLISVYDSMVNRDGYDVLCEVETLKFLDQEIETKTIRPLAQKENNSQKDDSTPNENPSASDSENIGKLATSITSVVDRNSDDQVHRNETPDEVRELDTAEKNSDSRREPKMIAVDTKEMTMASLDSKASIAQNTNWNLEQMSKRCKGIEKNKHGHYEAILGNGHTLVFIPQCSFPMGTEKLKRLDKPVHRVGLKGYWIGKYLVTNSQFRQFITETNFKTDAERPNAEGPYVYNFEERYFKPTPGRTWRDAFKQCIDDHPVVAVSWHDSHTYNKWLGKQIGLELTLPTEAQWEKAARGTDERMFPWGNTPPDGSKTNFCDSQFAKIYPGARQGNPEMNADDGYAGLSPVNAFPKGASPYGVFDMGGNVSNWVADWIGKYPRADVIEPVGPFEGDNRCMRGGFWVADAGLTKASIREQHNCRSACRSADDPRSSDDHLGFRFALQFNSADKNN